MNPYFLGQLLNDNTGGRPEASNNRSGPYRAPAPPATPQSNVVCNMCVQYHGALEGISTDINFLKETILMLQNKWSGILYNSFLLQHQSIAAAQHNLQQKQLMRATSLNNRHVNTRASDKHVPLNNKHDASRTVVNTDVGNDDNKDSLNTGVEDDLSLDEARLRVLNSFQQSLGLNPEAMPAEGIEQLRNNAFQPLVPNASDHILGKVSEGKRSYTRGDLVKLLNIDQKRDIDEKTPDFGDIKTVEIPDPTFSDALNFKGITWLVKKKGWCVFYVENGKVQQENFTPSHNEKQDDVLKRALDFRRSKCKQALEKELIQVLPLTPSEDEVKEYFLGLNRTDNS